MSAVGITENIKGDSKKFEVWYNGREEVYIIQVRWTTDLPLSHGQFELFVLWMRVVSRTIPDRSTGSNTTPGYYLIHASLLRF